MSWFRCFIGWHAWDLKELPKHFGAIRTCDECGVREQLVPDDGGWNAGLWVPVDKDQ